ncbi:MAG: phosphonopyruvate decarboxylase, partial [Clostridiales bacterium]|nr:phosphonopyruvate decarboxylase [Clostridiales bacterium]
MNVLDFVKQLKNNGINFYTGVPDSQLKPLCNYLVAAYGASGSYGDSNNHIIAANEGNAVAIAAGYYLSTGRIPCVYLQNSGLGNIINPVASLLNEKVYGIPCVFVIGWRGEPGTKDEPQHTFQGEVTLKLLEVMDIAYMVIDKTTTEKDLEDKLAEFMTFLRSGKSVAFVVKKGALFYDRKVDYKNENTMRREDVIRRITDIADGDI